MSNKTVTQIDFGNVGMGHGVVEDGPLTFAAPGTVESGTILARDTGTDKWVPFVVGGGTDGTPKAVLTYDVTATVAGDVPIRALVSGKVKKERLIIHADGDGSNITPAILDTLRSFDVVAEATKQLGRQET